MCRKKSHAQQHHSLRLRCYALHRGRVRPRPTATAHHRDELVSITRHGTAHSDLLRRVSCSSRSATTRSTLDTCSITLADSTNLIIYAVAEVSTFPV